MGKVSSIFLGVVTGAATAAFLTSKAGKEVTAKVSDFFDSVREDPEGFKDSVVKGATDFSHQASDAVKQAKEKVENGEVTTETVIKSVRETGKQVVDYSQEVFQDLKDKFNAEQAASPEAEEAEEPAEAIIELIEEPSEDIVINLDTKEEEEN